MISLLLLLSIPTILNAQESKAADIDVNELVFGHIGDAYEWHIATFGDTPVSIPLPIIVRSSTGWHVFCSSELEDGKEYDGCSGWYVQSEG